MPPIQGDAELELISMLARRLQCGAAALDAVARLRCADPQARALLGAPSGDAAACWGEFALQAELTPARLTAATGPLRLSAQAAAGPPVQLEIQPLADGYLALLRDPRHCASLDAALLAASRMYAFNGLAGALAHDFRGPLNAMQLTLELLSVSVDDEAGGAAPGGADSITRRRRYINVLKQELARLSPRLQALLGFNEPLDAAAQRLDLRDLIQEATALLESQARRQRVTLEISLPEQAAPLTGRRACLKQAVLNITLSALESMPDGGRLRLRAGAVENHYRLAVCDTGPGLPQALLEEMQAFAGAAPRSSRGISLYVARRVAEAHGGVLRISRAPAAGDCYELLLPCDPTLAV